MAIKFETIKEQIVIVLYDYMLTSDADSFWYSAASIREALAMANSANTPRHSTTAESVVSGSETTQEMEDIPLTQSSLSQREPKSLTQQAIFCNCRGTCFHGSCACNKNKLDCRLKKLD